MSKKVCAICPNKSSQETGKSYHRIPKDLERRKVWIKNLNIDLQDTISDHACICSDHFPELAFSKTSEKRQVLTLKAVPNIHYGPADLKKNKGLSTLFKEKRTVLMKLEDWKDLQLRYAESNSDPVRIALNNPPVETIPEVLKQEIIKSNPLQDDDLTMKTELYCDPLSIKSEPNDESLETSSEESDVPESIKHELNDNGSELFDENYLRQAELLGITPRDFKIEDLASSTAKQAFTKAMDVIVRQQKEIKNLQRRNRRKDAKIKYLESIVKVYKEHNYA